MVTIFNCSNAEEANRIRMRLEMAGIPAFIPDEIMASTAPHHFLTPSGVRVQVAEKDEEDARRLLQEDRTGEQ